MRLIAASIIATALTATSADAASLNGVTPVLKSKIQQIISKCGSRVVSAVSHRGNKSNHPIGKAVDLTGNPLCIYAMLIGWPGGVSMDYATAPGGPHVHISYNPGGQEWGTRFRHSKRSTPPKALREREIHGAD